MLVTSIFSFSYKVFYPIKKKKKKLHHLNIIEIVVCKYFQFGPGQKFDVW